MIKRGIFVPRDHNKKISASKNRQSLKRSDNAQVIGYTSARSLNQADKEIGNLEKHLEHK